VTLAERPSERSGIVVRNRVNIATISLVVLAGSVIGMCAALAYSGLRSETAWFILQLGSLIALVISGIAVIRGRNGLGAERGDRLGVVVAIISAIAIFLGIMWGAASNPY
jgi:hypothetical protein